MSIRSNLRQLRKDKGLTQGQLAQQVGVSPNYIWMLEKRTRKLPSEGIWGRLAVALGVLPAELFLIEPEISA